MQLRDFSPVVLVVVMVFFTACSAVPAQAPTLPTPVPQPTLTAASPSDLPPTPTAASLNILPTPQAIVSSDTQLISTIEAHDNDS